MKEYPTLHTTFKTASLLSAIIAILAIVASVGGLFSDHLYRDNAWATTAFRGDDLVTLVIAVPLLVGALILARRGRPRAQLIWLAMVAYMVYNYAFYLFGATFNRFFLLYVALVSLSILALIFGLQAIDINGISQQFHVRTPVKWISGFMLVFAVVLGGLWIFQSLSYVVTGQLPQLPGYNLVFALDLSLLVPSLVLGAILLWKRSAWGYVLGTILNVMGTVYLTTVALL